MPTKNGQPTKAELAQRLDSALALALRQRRALRGRMAATLRREAARSNRFRRDRFGAVTLSQSQLARDRAKFREKSRWLWENVGAYEGLLRAIANLAIGPGLKPIFASDAAQRVFDEWAQSGADARGLSDFASLQRMAMLDMLVDGDVLGVFVEEDADANTAPVSMQLVPGYRIQSPAGSASRENESDGVKTDQMGRIERFSVRVGDALKHEYEQVASEDAVFAAWRSCCDDARGWPYLATSLDRFIDQEEFIDATLTSAKIAAMFAVIIKSLGQSQSLQAMADHTETETVGDNGGERTRQAITADPGSLLELSVGEDIEQVQSEHPAPSFEAFMRRMDRRVAAATGVPVEIGMSDVSEANFSVARLADLIGQQSVRPLRDVFIGAFLRPIAMRVVPALGQRDASHEWPDPARSLINPDAELSAAAKAFALDLDSKQEWMQRHGRDYDATRERREAERAAEGRGGREPAEDAIATGGSERDVRNPQAEGRGR